VQHLCGPDPVTPEDSAAPLLGAGGPRSTTPDPLSPAPDPAAPAAEDTSAAERVALLGELAHVLVAPDERGPLLAHALELGARLVPDVGRWMVYAVAPGAPRALLLAATHGDAPTAIAASPASSEHGATLGLGDGTDRQVLEQRRRVVLDAHSPARPHHRNGERDAASERGSGACLPLVSFDGQLIGALVALARAGATLERADLRLLDTIAYHLTPLLARPPRPADQDTSAARPNGAPDPRIEFISLAAHELRNPLTSVKGYAQLLLRAARKSTTFSENQLRALQSIEQQATRMSDMVAELLDASRIQRGTFEIQPRLVDLEGLARRVVEQRAQGLERHELRLEADPVALVGRWDPQRLEQVIRDLIDNAIRYSPDGGVVSVRIWHADHFAHLCVRDEGIGIPPEERERIFAPFYRGAEARRRSLSGLGLGLFVSRTIVEALGGRLWLDLPEGNAAARRGSQFCLTLPLAGADTAPSA
jgi:signal transduction histidine kinase